MPPVSPRKDKDLPNFLRNPGRSSKATLFYAYHFKFPEEWEVEDYRSWVERVSEIVSESDKSEQPDKPKEPKDSNKPESTKLSDDSGLEFKQEISLAKLKLELYIRKQCRERWTLWLPMRTPVTGTDDLDGVTIGLYCNRGYSGARLRRGPEHRARDETTRDEVFKFIRSTLGLGDDVEPMWYFDAEVHGASAHNYAPFKGAFLGPSTPKSPDPSTPKPRTRKLA
ncbi:hypothetical protein C8Q80DRAFT_1271032 [Daedaleopsis nitida]|nr:hypothetical protein C8Q80DRAFT_1271032 [Daedaleopsis nitida]